MISQTKSQNQNNIDSTIEPSFFTKLFASGFYSGYSPIASGTVGSVVALGIYFIPGFESKIIIIPVALIVCLFGIKASSIMEKKYGHDPAEVTIDEVVGMWVSLFFLPKSILVASTAFFIFRFFDIIKPFPARKFDNMHGGSGIMMDDVIAGIYTNIFLQLVLLIPSIKEIFMRF